MLVVSNVIFKEVVPIKLFCPRALGVDTEGCCAEILCSLLPDIILIRPVLIMSRNERGE